MSDGCGALCNSTGCASIKLALVKCSAQNFPIILSIINGTLESSIFEFSIHLSASSLGMHSTWEGTTFAIVLDARNTKDKGNFLVVQRLSLHTSMAGVQFWSLVKELRSLMPCGTVKEKKKGGCIFAFKILNEEEWDTCAVLSCFSHARLCMTLWIIAC